MGPPSESTKTPRPAVLAAAVVTVGTAPFVPAVSEGSSTTIDRSLPTRARSRIRRLVFAGSPTTSGTLMSS